MLSVVYEGDEAYMIYLMGRLWQLWQATAILRTTLALVSESGSSMMEGLFGESLSGYNLSTERSPFHQTARW